MKDGCRLLRSGEPEGPTRTMTTGAFAEAADMIKPLALRCRLTRMDGRSLCVWEAQAQRERSKSSVGVPGGIRPGITGGVLD